MNKTAKALSTQARIFFGLLPGQTGPQFANELATLNVHARKELADELKRAGLPVRAESIRNGHQEPA